MRAKACGRVGVVDLADLRVLLELVADVVLASLNGVGDCVTLGAGPDALEDLGFLVDVVGLAAFEVESEGVHVEGVDGGDV